MLLIYFQGLGLISNDSTATAAETGAFLKHTLAAFYLDAVNLNTLIPVPFPFLGFLTNPNLIQSEPACLCCAVAVLCFFIHLIILKRIYKAHVICGGWFL